MRSAPYLIAMVFLLTVASAARSSFPPAPAKRSSK